MSWTSQEFLQIDWFLLSEKTSEPDQLILLPEVSTFIPFIPFLSQSKQSALTTVQLTLMRTNDITPPSILERSILRNLKNSSISSKHSSCNCHINTIIHLINIESNRNIGLLFMNKYNFSSCVRRSLNPFFSKNGFMYLFIIFFVSTLFSSIIHLIIF